MRPGDRTPALLLVAAAAVVLAVWGLWPAAQPPAADPPSGPAPASENPSLSVASPVPSAPEDPPEPSTTRRLLEPADTAPVRTPSGRLRPPRPDDWARLRAEAEATWREANLEAAGAWLRAREVEATRRDALIEALEAMHARISATRRSIEAGQMSPAEGREEIAGATEAAASAIEGILGEAQMQELRTHLRARTKGGGF